MLPLKKLIGPFLRVINEHSKLCICRISSNTNTIKHYDKQADAIRIGCASGFWGDTAVAAPQLIHHGNIDFLVFDYLSEITMSLLTAVKSKMPNMGYAPDFVQISMAPYISSIKEKGIRVISNAGGVNPHACADSLRQAATNQNVDLNVAVVTGDDLMSKVESLREGNCVDMNTGLLLPKSVTSMNAYLGAGPIARALDLGADVVVTGRCVDSALVLAPLIHKFGWSFKDYNLMSAGSLAGHLVECGAQATGGIFTDWDQVDGWDKIGFPIVECESGGKFVVTKPPATGGLVSTGTVSEQMLYEIGDPARYHLPDVICDFSNTTLQPCQLGKEQGVIVDGAVGLPPTSNYKVSATYADGYRVTAVCVVGGPRSVERARKTADAILKRCRRMFKLLGLDDFSRVHVEILGAEDRYGKRASVTKAAREAVIWIAVHHHNKKALELLAREIAPAGTGMAPGLTGIVGGRPSVSPVLKLFSFLHHKSQFKIDIHMNGEFIETYKPEEVTWSEPQPQSNQSADTSSLVESGKFNYRLEDLAYTRSGDKGNSANIGVVARDPAYLPYIRSTLTPEAMYDYFQHLFEPDSSAKQNVLRYEVPGIHALNFVLVDVLGGGGIASLRSDPQGKALAQMLLDFEIQNVPELRKK